MTSNMLAPNRKEKSPQPAEHMEIGQAVKEEDAFGQPIGMLHLVDRFVPLEFGETLHAPIIEHPVMQPILVDRRQFVPERFIEQLDNLFVTLHRGLLCCRDHSLSELRFERKSGGKLRKIGCLC